MDWQSEWPFCFLSPVCKTTLPMSCDPPSGLLVVISGPSGVGKTTIAHRVEQQLKGVFSISMTTRPKTEADVEGEDYYFVDHATFEHARKTAQLLEWAEVFGHWYGTPREPVIEAMTAGKLMVLEIDVQGAQQVKQNMADAFAIFVLPPNEAALLSRLRGRQREDESVIQRRFNQARNEIVRAKAGTTYDLFLINDDLTQAEHQIIDRVRAEWDKRRNRD